MRTFNFVIDQAVSGTTNSFKQLTQNLWITNGIQSGAAKQIPACRYLSIKPGSYAKTAANPTETLQVSTVTFVGTANGVTYGVKLTQLNPYGGLQPLTGAFYSNAYIITTPATGSVTPTTIGDQVRAAINADPKIKVAATGTTTMVLTAEAGYPTFQVEIINVGNGATYVTGTAGVSSFGVAGIAGVPQYIDLLQAGLQPTDFTGSTLGYTRYSWVATQADGNGNPIASGQNARFNVFVNNDEWGGHAYSAALITAIDAIFAQASYVAGTTALA